MNSSGAGSSSQMYFQNNEPSGRKSNYNNKNRKRQYTDDHSKCKGASNGVLVLQWPITVCVLEGGITGPCVKSYEKSKVWMLHSYWLIRANGNYFITNCEDHDAPQSRKKPKTTNCNNAIALFNDRMKDANPSSPGHYERDYKKHGKCVELCVSLDGADELKCQIGKLLQEYNIGEVLKVGRITPGGFYSLAQINRAIINYTGRTPWIECYYVGTGGRGYVGTLTLLYEIRLYFDLNFKIMNVAGRRKPIQCQNENVYTNVNQEKAEEYIYYPESRNDVSQLNILINNMRAEESIQASKNGKPANFGKIIGTGEFLLFKMKMNNANPNPKLN